MRRVAIVLLLAGCPAANESRVSTASWVVEGATRVERAVDDREAGRVTCTVDRDPDDPLDATPLFTLAITAASDGREAPGIFFAVRDFQGAATYDLGLGARGRVLLFDATTLEACADPAETRCFVAEGGCSLFVERWELGTVVAPGVRNGSAVGRFDCASLENPATEGTVRLSSGSFTCRASDWTASRGP